MLVNVLVHCCVVSKCVSKLCIVSKCVSELCQTRCFSKCVSKCSRRDPTQAQARPKNGSGAPPSGRY